MTTDPGDISMDPAFGVLQAFLSAASMADARQVVARNVELRAPEALGALDALIRRAHELGHRGEHGMRAKREWLASIQDETTYVSVVPPEITRVGGYAVARCRADQPYAGLATEDGFTEGESVVLEMGEGVCIFGSAIDAIGWSESRGWVVINKATLI